MRTYDDAFSGQRIYPGKVRKDLIDFCVFIVLDWNGLEEAKEQDGDGKRR